jgi:hypothetical protein
VLPAIQFVQKGASKAAAQNRCNEFEKTQAEERFLFRVNINDYTDGGRKSVFECARVKFRRRSHYAAQSPVHIEKHSQEWLCYKRMAELTMAVLQR